MSKNKKKQTWLRVHPVHFHIGMYVAIAAVLVTAMKTSEGVIAVMYGQSAHTGNILSETYMREAETHIGHAQLNFARHPSVSGM